MPTAWYEDCDNTSDPSYSFQLFSKYLGNIFEVKLNHSPFDVVGWHGKRCNATLIALLRIMATFRKLLSFQV